MSYDDAQRLRVRRDPDRARQNANEETVTAVGAQLPSGQIIIEWRRDAFAPGERSEEPVVSIYRNVLDAEQATAGTIEFVED